MVDWTHLRDSLRPQGWAGVGILGILVFLVGVYAPLWSGLPLPALLEEVVAIAGGGLAVFGFTLAWDAYQAIQNDPRRRPLPPRAELIARLGPGVEIYRPPPRSESGPEESPDEEES